MCSLCTVCWWLSLCCSVCLSVSVCLHLSVSSCSVSMYIWGIQISYVCLSVYLSVCLPVCSSVCLSLSVSLSVCLSVSLCLSVLSCFVSMYICAIQINFVYLSVRRSVCLSVSFSVSNNSLHDVYQRKHLLTMCLILSYFNSWLKIFTSVMEPVLISTSGLLLTAYYL